MDDSPVQICRRSTRIALVSGIGHLASWCLSPWARSWPATAGEPGAAPSHGGSLNDALIVTATLTYFGWVASWNSTKVPDGTNTQQSKAYRRGWQPGRQSCHLRDSVKPKWVGSRDRAGVRAAFNVRLVGLARRHHGTPSQRLDNSGGCPKTTSVAARLLCQRWTSIGLE